MRWASPSRQIGEARGPLAQADPHSIRRMAATDTQPSQKAHCEMGMAPDEAVEHGSNAGISMLAMVLEMRTRFLVAPVLSVLVTLPAGCGVVHAALGTRVSQVGGTGSPVEEPVARKVAGGAQGRPPPGRGQPAKQRTLRPVVARGTAKLEVGCGHLLSGTDRGAVIADGAPIVVDGSAGIVEL